MNISHHWILDAAGEPIPCSDVQTWARWFEGSDKARRVNLTQVGRFRVSTVFLSLDHAWPRGIGEPLLWETMVFIGQGLDEVAMDRCSGGRAEAQAMHDRMVARVKSGEFDHELQAATALPQHCQIAQGEAELARLREQNRQLRFQAEHVLDLLDNRTTGQYQNSKDRQACEWLRAALAEKGQP